MDFNIIRKLNPKLKNLDNNKLLYFLSYNLKEKKEQYNLILNLDDFKKIYPKFEINYYVLFNNDLYNNFNNIIDFYSHYINIGINEDRIINFETYIDKNIDFNYDFFNEINEYYLYIDLYKIDLGKFKLDFDDKIKKIKLYDLEKNDKNSKYILNFKHFEQKFPNIDLEFIALFNNSYFENISKSKYLSDEMVIKIVKFYLENKNKNINCINYIFNEKDFNKKYPNFNYSFFIKFNNLEMERIEAMIYYHNNRKLISCKNEVIDLDFKKEIEEKNFDWKFYLDFYPDLKKMNFDNEKICYLHYKEYGKNEGRKCNKNDLINNYNKELNLLKKEEILDIDEKPENLINILIRNCYRPKLFKECIESILEQNYNNYRIIICYDDEKCVEYLNYYDDKRIKKYKIEIESNNEYKYELYCNDLLEKVEKGWIMFLDDDDKFMNKNSLKLINQQIDNKKDFIIWKFLRSDMIIYFKDINNIKYGEIATGSYLFHSKYKNLSKWEEKYGGDYEFVNNLLNQNNFIRKKMDKILVGNIKNDKIGSYGKNELFDYLNYNNIELINKNKINNEYKYEFVNIFAEEFLIKIINKNTENKKIILIIGESLYPPNGGGENWLLDISKFLSDKYFFIGLCFKDIINNVNFSKINYIDLDYINVLQMPYYYDDLINIIRYINPYVINHQGSNRLEFMKISKILDIKFVTGFCFWNDIISIDEKYTNINMINRNYKKDKNFDIICKNSFVYVVSKFMNNIIKNLDTKYKNLTVINSISNENNYKINKINNYKNKYVCVLNSHYLKGGIELLYLLDNLDINIPILAIITEQCDIDGFYDKIEDRFNERNKINNINILFKKKQNNIKEIYEKSEIILIPSIVDETFCKVAYEAKQNNLKIIAYDNGNLKFLLDNYNNNIFIKNNIEYTLNNLKNNNENIIHEDILKLWRINIENIYYKEKIEHKIENKIENKIEKNEINLLINLFEKKNVKINKKKNIGIFAPFCDQGLGIQAREYYYFLKKNGFNVCVFSHKANIAKQICIDEWSVDNIYYSDNTRENINLNEIINFCFNYNISKLIVPEICYQSIYPLLRKFKMLNVEILTPFNIETLRYSEVENYKYIDTILCNNLSSYYIIKKYINHNDIKLLEFDNYYMSKFKKNYTKIDKIIFSTFGGLNSLFRKNIDITYNIFKKIEEETDLDFELNIIIQDESLKKHKLFTNTKKINIIVKNNNYKNIISYIKKSHIIIHLGSHEGLGLGFFESLNNNKPLITLNTYPNKEFVNNKESSFLINCSYEELEDNNEGIINKANIHIIDYYEKMIKILDPNFKNKILEIINTDKFIKNNYKNNFLNLLK